jgi:hypothetical protein
MVVAKFVCAGLYLEHAPATVTSHHVTRSSRSVQRLQVDGLVGEALNCADAKAKIHSRTGSICCCRVGSFLACTSSHVSRLSMTVSQREYLDGLQDPILLGRSSCKV